MATLFIHNIPEQELADLNALAREDNVPLEEEAKLAIRHYAKSRRDTAGLIPRDRLLAEAEALHRSMAARGVCLSAEEINTAIKEARR